MKILIISDTPTHPTYAGNRFGILSNSKLLKSLGHEIDFLWISESNPSNEETSQMQSYWASNLYQFKKKKIQIFINKFYKEFRFRLFRHYNVDDLSPLGLSNYLFKLQEKNNYPCVIVNYIYLSKCFRVLGNVNKILFTHDVFTDCYQKTGNTWFSTTAKQEAKALNRADVVWAVQENEAVFFKSLTERKVVTMYGYFPPRQTRYIGNQVLLFLSGPNHHNLKAINSFIEKQFPPLAKQFPNLRLLIGGSICSKISGLQNNSQVQLLGEVNDLDDFYSLGDIFINPVFSGTGLKIKTFEAMAYGKIVICHPHGTEGIYRKDEAPILLAETFNDYSMHLKMLFGDKEQAKTYKNKTIAYINQFAALVRQRIDDSIRQNQAIEN